MFGILFKSLRNALAKNDKIHAKKSGRNQCTDKQRVSFIFLFICFFCVCERALYSTWLLVTTKRIQESFLENYLNVHKRQLFVGLHFNEWHRRRLKLVRSASDLNLLVLASFGAKIQIIIFRLNENVENQITFYSINRTAYSATESGVLLMCQRKKNESVEAIAPRHRHQNQSFR